MKVRVSRKDIFQGHEPQEKSELVYMPDLELVEVSHESERPSEPDMGFRLFDSIVAVSLNEDDSSEQLTVQRPPDWYRVQYSRAEKERFRQSAVQGAQILEAAKAVLELARPCGEDINAGYRPPRKKCRPGQAVRARRKAAKRAKKDLNSRFHPRPRRPRR